MNDLAELSQEAPRLCLCGCEPSTRGSEREQTTKDFCDCGCGSHEDLALVTASAETRCECGCGC